ncbi:HEAT repeat domain-containing protein [Sediminicola luteus]|uniref:HEAT repeat domain-containing protein n=1 Tax=Sediminicola luteus TaxID=319238 RepID=A0A2A4GDI4_9FLAO|nr:HEAT repeat domain-containing protein [Sediminicola luteus]PCE65845.1 hypothetical protein B7P33_00650 [Sediminicola luteus]
MHEKLVSIFLAPEFRKILQKLADLASPRQWPEKILHPLIWTLEFVAIPCLILLAVFGVSLLLRKEYHYRIRKPKLEVIPAKIDLFLAEILFMDFPIDQISDEVIRFKNQIPFHRNWCENLVLSKFLDLKRNVYDLNLDAVSRIYSGFGFENRSAELINNPDPYQIKLGIRQIQILELKSKRREIRNIWQSNQDDLESTSLIALIALADNNLEALQHYRGPMPLSDEIRILEILERNPSCIPNNIHKLLRSNNPSLIVLGIKIMGINNNRVSLERTKRLLKHSCPKVRRATIRQLSSWAPAYTVELLIETYKRENESSIKTLIIQLLALQGNQSSLSFARICFIRERDPLLKFELLKCIQALDKRYFESLDANRIPDHYLVSEMINHIKETQ